MFIHTLYRVKWKLFLRWIIINCKKNNNGGPGWYHCFLKTYSESASSQQGSWSKRSSINFTIIETWFNKYKTQAKGLSVCLKGEQGRIRSNVHKRLNAEVHSVVSPLERWSQFLCASLRSRGKTLNWPACTCSPKLNSAGWFPCAAGTDPAGCRLVPTEWAR